MKHHQEFQHPETGVSVTVYYRFGRLHIEVENLADFLEDRDGDEARDAEESHAETLRLVAPYRGRRCRSLAEAERTLEEISAHYDYFYID